MGRMDGLLTIIARYDFVRQEIELIDWLKNWVLIYIFLNVMIIDKS